MKLTSGERLMYQVMKAISDSGIPISFKGAMVLRACLDEHGYADDTRHTMDIDADWLTSEPPTAELMCQSIQSALDQAQIALSVNLTRMYGTGRSAGFEFRNQTTNEVFFTMDMDVNRPASDIKLYTVENFSFQGIVVWQILAEKISALSTNSIFRRIKDMVDLYYLSQCVPLDYKKVMMAMTKTNRLPSSFESFLTGQEALAHAYDKFRFSGSSEKPSFEKVYGTVKTYVKDFLPH